MNYFAERKIQMYSDIRNFLESRKEISYKEFVAYVEVMLGLSKNSAAHVIDVLKTLKEIETKEGNILWIKKK